MRRAVVLGGSIAGLLAARVLSDHADEVLILERDDVAPPGAHCGARDPRPGVPQGTQMHALLEAGRRRIDAWFPGFAAELVADGATLADTGRQLHSYLDGRRKVLVDGVEMISATRPFIEAHLRDRVLSLGNLRLVNGRVRGLNFTGDRVSGVRYEAGTRAARTRTRARTRARGTWRPWSPTWWSTPPAAPAGSGHGCGRAAGPSPRCAACTSTSATAPGCSAAPRASTTRPWPSPWPPSRTAGCG